MARPPLPLGHHGEISVAPENGRWVARCRVRGVDGVTRKVEEHRRTRTAARQALQEDLRTRSGERREDSTLDIYRHWLNKVVPPQLGEARPPASGRGTASLPLPREEDETAIQSIAMIIAPKAVMHRCIGHHIWRDERSSRVDERTARH